jgi:peroxiredoxin
MAEPCTSAGAIERFLGAAVPTSRFKCYAGTPVAVPELGASLVLYLYPGSVCSPEDGYESPLRDSVQHRAFEDSRKGLGALGYSAVGLSSQSVDVQRRVAADTGVRHTLLSDPGLLLASALGLPTFNMDRDDWYCRFTVVIQGGRIAAAFYPSSAARSAGEAIAWIRERGVQVVANGS